jgi:hypothetical protein
MTCSKQSQVGGSAPNLGSSQLISITDRYRPLTSFTQKLRFLIDIQVNVFDKLEERLRGNLEAYLTLTTSLGRAMGGVSKEEQDRLLGVEGLERLCKTYGSADYLERAMRDWSDDVVGCDRQLFRQIDSRGLTLAIVFPRHLG